MFEWVLNMLLKYHKIFQMIFFIEGLWVTAPAIVQRELLSSIRKKYVKEAWEMLGQTFFSVGVFKGIKMGTLARLRSKKILQWKLHFSCKVTKRRKICQIIRKIFKDWGTLEGVEYGGDTDTKKGRGQKSSCIFIKKK